MDNLLDMKIKVNKQKDNCYVIIVDYHSCQPLNKTSAEDLLNSFIEILNI